MEFLIEHHAVIGAAWFWISIPLVLTVFFRFGRLWSIRNFDLLLLLGVAAGVVLVRYVPFGETAGATWLFTVTGILLIRLLGDRWFQKRPRMETNLIPPALTFLGLTAAGALVVAIVIMPVPTPSYLVVEQGQEILDGSPAEPSSLSPVTTPTTGPAHKIAAAPAVEISRTVAAENGEHDSEYVEQLAARILAGMAQLAVLAALFFIGLRYFEDARLGWAAATLYLLLPSTLLDPNAVPHVLSAGLILWALALHRRPAIAGILMGLACGSSLYPVLLLPVWLAFYGRKGAIPFTTALLGISVLLLGGLALLSADLQDYVYRSLQLIAANVRILMEGESPLTWTMTDVAYRVPILVAFLLMLVGLTFWPQKKRLEHLLAHTAALLVGIQFWYPQQREEYLTAYIPLVILVALRPRLIHNGRSEPAPHQREDAGRPQTERIREPLLLGVTRHERLYR